MSSRCGWLKWRGVVGCFLPCVGTGLFVTRFSAGGPGRFRGRWLMQEDSRSQSIDGVKKFVMRDGP